MKDENGIEIKCENCKHSEYCDDKFYPDTVTTANSCGFLPSVEAYEARIADLEKKLTETIKLLSESSRECGELEAYNEVLQRRVQEFSMELLDRTMKENKDVLERLKNWEEYLDKDLSPQSTDAADVSKNGENSTENEEK